MLNTDRSNQADTSIQSDPSLDPSDPGNFGEDINDEITYSDGPIVGSSEPTDYYGSTPTNVTREEISQLFFKLSSNKDAKADSDLLDLLRDALQDLNQGNLEKANGEYQSALQTSSDGQSPWSDPQLNGALQDAGSDPESQTQQSGEEANLAEADSNGDLPTRTDEQGIKYFESTDSQQDLNLKATGEGSQNVIKTDGSVTLTPQAPEDPISLSESGGQIIVHMKHSGKTDIFKLSNRTSLHINSEYVTGDVTNAEKKITFGQGDISQTFFSIENRDTIAQKIKSAVDKVIIKAEGSQSAEINDVNPGDEVKKAKDVKKVLGLLGSAIQETDPDAKKSLYDNVTELVKNWKTQSSNPSSHGAALLMKVLFGELGHNSLKTAVQFGLLPKDFVQALSDDLKVLGNDSDGRPDPLNDVSTNYQIDSYMDNQHYLGNRSGWTNATAMSNLQDWAGLSDSGSSSNGDIPADSGPTSANPSN